VYRPTSAQQNFLMCINRELAEPEEVIDQQGHNRHLELI
jgi:hypothetical protein